MMKLTAKSLVLSTATFGLMLGVAQNAQAARLIPGVTVTSLSGTTSNSGWSLNSIVNGSGLPGNKPSLGGIHADTANTNAWRSNNTTIVSGNLASPIEIVFKLGNVPTDLIGLSFWNATGVPASFGVKNASFEYSTNGTDFLPLVPLTPFTSFAQGLNTAQVVNFSLVQATHVRFNITSNYGGQRVAINEVQFKSIPEPSASLALLALGLAGGGLRKRI